MSGNVLPRLQTEDIEELPVPIVDAATQERIANEANKRSAEADQLFKQAEAELEQAKRQIESLLLGEIGEASNPESAARMTAKR
jgi:restriction endonuclease S subunit